MQIKMVLTGKDVCLAYNFISIRNYCKGIFRGQVVTLNEEPIVLKALNCVAGANQDIDLII